MSRELIRKALSRDRHRRRLLVAWGSFAVAELVLAWLGMAPVPLWSALAEVAGLCTVGVIHAGLAPDDWRGSAAWPAAAGTAAIAWRMAAEGVRLAFSTMSAMMPLAGLGMVLLAGLAVLLLDRLLWRRVPAVLLSLAGPLSLHLVLIGPGQLSQPFLPMPVPTADGPPMVVVTVDTLRSDAAAGMESVRRLAPRGATWARATAPSSWTWPSLVTLWSGVAAETHGSGRVADKLYEVEGWSGDLRWLPDDLRDAGYVGAAFAGNPMLREMGLAASFDHFELGSLVGVPFALAGYLGRGADAGDARYVVDAALSWLDDAPPRGFLLWVHLFEPHLPYSHSTENPYTMNLLRKVKMGAWFMGENEREAVRRAYLEEVAYADAEIARLLDALEHRGHFDDGVVVLTSDHGEEFWEHGGFEHGHSHHGEVIDIPLVLVAPGVTPGPREDVAALQDVAPTLASIAGLDWAGIDLRRPIADDRVAHAFGNLYHRPMRSARMGTTRVIVDGGAIRAYDLVLDPEEREPRITSPAEMQALARSRPEASRTDLEVRALRALGYVH